MNELDEKMQKMAIEHWAFFVALVGKDALIIGKARVLRSEGKSWQQISIKLGITVSQAKYACKDMPAKI